MNKDQTAGRIDEMRGRLKEVAGRVIGDEGLQARGTIQKLAGKAQADYGDFKADVQRLSESS
jgi:uncharacterized protein YjbJ (UPF0337 family)